MDIVNVLRTLGLSDGEVRVYLSLLDLGETTVGPLTKAASVSPSKIYNILERLVKKSVVGYMMVGKTRHYRALEPKYLKDFLNEKRDDMSRSLEMQETQLQAAMPELDLRFHSVKQEEHAEIFEGIRGIKTFFDMSLEECGKDDDIETVGYPKIASEMLNAYFREYNAKRAKIGFTSKAIFDYDAWFAKRREPRKFVEYAYFPKDFETPAFIAIFKDKVGTIILTEKQKLCIMIKNRTVADSYRQYFKLMWKTAIKVK